MGAGRPSWPADTHFILVLERTISLQQSVPNLQFTIVELQRFIYQKVNHFISLITYKHASAEFSNCSGGAANTNGLVFCAITVCLLYKL